MMTDAVHLQSSLTFVPPTMLKGRPGDVIDADAFASEDQHIILNDTDLAASLRDFAMREGMALAKIAVGSKEDSTPVEFFWLDVKKNKKEVTKLTRLLSRRWLESIQEVELAREDADGNLLAPEITSALGAIESMINVRRFLANGTEPSILSKKKRTVLLFHHTLANAPESN